MVEKGEAVTSISLAKIMHDLYLSYFDIDLDNEKYKDMVWASIPHFFHTPYYVYQYATSYSASLALYNKVKAGVKICKYQITVCIFAAENSKEFTVWMTVKNNTDRN